MKYRIEKEWNPSTNYTKTNRNLKRDEKNFAKKLLKKASPFLKWVYNNYLSESEKVKIFDYYERNDEYYNFIGKNKEINSNRLIVKLIDCGSITEKLAKVIKRKWIISKILK